MPYKSKAYKSFIQSARWRRIRAAHLKTEPLCRFCFTAGNYRQATDVDHIVPCHDDSRLQEDPTNLPLAMSGASRPLCDTIHGEAIATKSGKMAIRSMNVIRPSDEF